MDTRRLAVSSSFDGTDLNVTIRGHEKRKEDGKVVYNVMFTADGGITAAESVQNWETQKRYSEFDELRATLQKLHGAEIKALPFPPKVLRNSADAIKDRERTLQAFLQGAVRLITPTALERCDGSAASVLYQFLVATPRHEDDLAFADRSLPCKAMTATTTRSTVLVFENQRAGGLGDAISMAVPSEEKYCADKLMPVDPTPWSSASGCERPHPDSMTRYPRPGWRWAPDTEWKKGPWEYRPNFIGHAGVEATGVSLRDWDTEMSTSFGNKSWVRRRRWTRVAERDKVVWSGRLEKRNRAGSDIRWFVVCEAGISYFQLEHAHDNFDDLGAPVEPPPMAANGGVIPYGEIQTIIPGGVDTRLAESSFKMQLKTGRDVVLKASSRESVEVWTSKIREVAPTLVVSKQDGSAAAASSTPTEGAHPSDIILCAAVGVRTGADDWLDKKWTEGAAVVLTGRYVHVFDSGPPFWWSIDESDGPKAKMIRSLNLQDLRPLPAAEEVRNGVIVEEVTRSAEKPHELRLHTAARQSCLRLAFESNSELKQWAAALNKAIDDVAAGAHSGVCIPPLLPSDDEDMPADKCLIHVEVSGCHSLQRLSQYFCVRPDYFALFESLESLQAHIMAPCLNRPTIFYPLNGMEVMADVDDGDSSSRDEFTVKTADDRTLTLWGPEGVADRIRHAIRTEIDRIHEEGASSCRGCDFTPSCLDHYINAVRKVQENSQYSKDQRRMRDEAVEAENERMRMVEQKDMDRLQTFEGYASKVVRRDWDAREVMSLRSAGTVAGKRENSRLVTPALENMFSLCKILLQSDAEAQRQGEEITAVLAAFSSELANVLKTIEYDPADSTEARIELRLFFLAWIHNCLLLNSYVEELLYRKGVNTAETTALYDAARACQGGVIRLYKAEIDHLLTMSDTTTGEGGLFCSTNKTDSPVRETVEFLYSACTTELRIQECDGISSIAATEIADEILYHFADVKYFPTLLEKVRVPVGQQRPSGAATMSATTADFELRDFKFLLDQDLTVVERIYTLFYLMLTEAAENILVNADDDSCIETVHFPTESLDEFGLQINQKCAHSSGQAGKNAESLEYRAHRDEKLPHPLIVEGVVKGSEAYRAGLRRGMVLVASRNDSLRGEQRFLQLEVVQHLSKTILTIGDICEQLSAVRAVEDSIGDDDKSLQAFVRLCDYDTMLAYELVSAVPHWEDTALSKRVAEIDTNSIITRQLSWSARAQRGHLRADDALFRVRWWNTARGTPDDLEAARLPGSQFLSLRNASANALTVDQHWHGAETSWWQPPPAEFHGNSQLLTWAAAPRSGSSSFFGDTKGALVLTGRSNSGKDFGVLVCWSTPCLAFAPLERQKLLRQGFGPKGSYPIKPLVLIEHPQNLERPEELQAHFERLVASRQSKAQCRCCGIQVTCEVLTRVDRAALVQQLECLSLRKLRDMGVEHGVWPTLEAASAQTADATKHEIMQHIVFALCGKDDNTKLTCPQGGTTGSKFVKRTTAVTDKDLHQCLFTISDMTATQLDYAEHLEELVERMHGHEGLIAETRRYRLSQFRNCFIGKELVDWLVSALLQKADVSLQQLIPVDSDSAPISITCEQQLKLLKHLLKALQEVPAVPSGQSNVRQSNVNEAATQVALLRHGVVLIGRSMIELGMLRHVVDEHDFEDNGNFYRVACVPGSGRSVRKGMLEKTPGSLLKAGVTKWEKRWFELDEGTGTLRYYREEYGKLAGTIPPTDSGHVILSVKSAFDSREITVQCGPLESTGAPEQPKAQGRTFALRARSAEDASAWADAIKRERDQDNSSRYTAIAESEPGPELETKAAAEPERAQQPELEPEMVAEPERVPQPGPVPAAEIEESEPPAVAASPVARTRSKTANASSGGLCACCGSRPA